MLNPSYSLHFPPDTTSFILALYRTHLLSKNLFNTLKPFLSFSFVLIEIRVHHMNRFGFKIPQHQKEKQKQHMWDKHESIIFLHHTQFLLFSCSLNSVKPICLGFSVFLNEAEFRVPSSESEFELEPELSFLLMIKYCGKSKSLKYYTQSTAYYSTMVKFE